ncbi:LysR substrate-binding domain-containing protein [Streptomyces sp. YGL11-2]|uniref:LysR substrate-binding domain-containing protein n=1 Tax=Streptomyces sp. YGL11-2 TaxID=3414028 RepID=UPI003CEAC05A
MAASSCCDSWKYNGTGLFRSTLNWTGPSAPTACASRFPTPASVSARADDGKSVGHIVRTRWVGTIRADPAGHRLADTAAIPFTALLDEPFLALPESAGALRDSWPAVSERGGRPVRTGAVVAGAGETFEAVEAGLGVVLPAAGNAALYRRPRVVARPVGGLSPSRLALARRPDDHRTVLRDVIEAVRQLPVP